MATNVEAANLLPHEQTAVTLAALAVEMLTSEQQEQLLALADDLFDGYCLPEAGD